MHSLEHASFNGEGIYNLNVVKKIEVSDSFLGLSMNDKGCQNEEIFGECTTNHYIDTLLKQCGCLPLNIRVEEKVLLEILHGILITL